MAKDFSSLADFYAHGYDTLIDARSPGEYSLDHIPGAINLPVLDNAERAQVGTIYTRDDAFKAKKIGAALVARNVANHLDGPLSGHDGSWRPLVYCWRGGQRSGSFVTILKQVGWRADCISGGYQTYRRLVADAVHKCPLAHRFVVIDGNTGTAKTQLLKLLEQRGHQVIDLEGLAEHRGSVFGAMSAQQPSQKTFEGKLAAALVGHDPARPVLLEAESSKIGRLQIPASVWDAMKLAPRIAISAPLAERAKYLVRAYGDIITDTELLSHRLDALICHQGRERVGQWQNLAVQERMEELASELMQHHYDPSYGRSRAAHSNRVVEKLDMAELTPARLEQTAERLGDLILRLDEGKLV